MTPTQEQLADTEAWTRNQSDILARENGCWFNVRKAAYAVWWIERYCKLYEGDEFAGQPVTLRGCHQCGFYGIDVPDEFDDVGEINCIERANLFIECLKAGHEIDWQYECTMRTFGWVTYNEMRKRWVRRFREASIWVSKKNKKPIALDTPIPTPTGWVNFGELNVGDELFDENGRVCRVTHRTEVYENEDCYKLTFGDGTSVVAAAGHEWFVKRVTNKRRWQVYETEEIYLSQRYGTHQACNYAVRVNGALDCSYADLPIDPYLLGAWLGDGTSAHGRIDVSNGDDEILRGISSDRRFAITSSWKNTGGSVQYQFTGLRTELRAIGVLNNKHIPQTYLRASESQRWSLLQGLMDTDGCVGPKGQCIYVTTSDALKNGVVELLRTLGIKPTANKVVTTCQSGAIGSAWRILFTADSSMTVSSLQRKLSKLPRPKQVAQRSKTKAIVRVEKVPSVPVRCITVDSPSHLFLCGEGMIPTHNSPTMAAWGMYLLIGDEEQGQKVFLASKDGTQVRQNGAKHAMEMVRQSPALAEECSINKVECKITHEPSRSVMIPLSSSNERTTKSKEGLNGSMMVDETHVVDREFMNRTTRAGISRAEPLHAEFSTVGDDPDSYGKERFDLAERVAAGTEERQSLFSAIYAAPQSLSDADLDADPLKYGRMANPAMGHTVDPAEFMMDYKNSRGSPSNFAQFKMYRLNIWQNAAAPWLSLIDWNKGRRDFSLDDFEGRECWAALDLSSVKDFSALTLCFPEGDDTFAMFWWFWLPEETARAVQKQIPIQNWLSSPLTTLTLTPGARVDYGYIRSEFRELAQRFNIQELAYDDWNAEQTTQELSEGVHNNRGAVIEPGTGVPRLDFAQGIQAFNEPTKRFEGCVIDGKILHNGDPLAAWMIGNAVISPDKNGNYKPMKPKKDGVKKIDGVITAIMARWRADLAAIGAWTFQPGTLAL